MAFTQTGTDHQYWAQDLRYGLPGFSYHQIPDEGSWTTFDQIFVDAEVEVGRHHTVPYQPINPRDCLPPHHSRQDWPSYDFTKTVRYMSPSDSYGSSHSEISSTGETVFHPHVTTQPIRYSASPVELYNNHTFNTPIDSSGSHMPWQPQPSSHFINHTVHTVAPAFLPSQPALSLKEYETHQQEDSKLDLDFDEEIVEVHTKSPLNIPQPEELELSEASTISTASSTNGEHGANFQAADEMDEVNKEYRSDEDDESMAVDNDSDSDFTTRPKRRRNSRSGGVRGLKSPRHRRRISNQSILGNKSRVHKRSNSTPTPTSSHNRRPSKPKSKPKGPIFARKPSILSPPINKGERLFPCTFHHFGCPAEFPNKNEWKRHVACQHLQLGYYRCDLDHCDPDNVDVTAAGTTNSSNSTASLSRSSTQSRRSGSQTTFRNTNSPDSEEIIKIYNDFNRKDLFTQHCRRMHGPARNPALCSNPPTRRNGVLQPTKEDEAAFERQLDQIRKRCWHVRRKAPARSNCGFCDMVFDAAYYTGNAAEGQGPEEKAWEERMEHLGRHYEKENVTKEQESLDEDLVNWGLETAVFRRLENGKVWLVSADDPVSSDAITSGLVGPEDEDENKKKARRQPSRTVVVQKRTAASDTIIVAAPTARQVKKESHDSESSESDDDADGETE